MLERQVRRSVRFYNLDVILAVGCRVRSARGTQFHRRTTERLHEYLVKVLTLDDEPLTNPPVAGSAVPDRFDELWGRSRRPVRAKRRALHPQPGLITRRLPLPYRPFLRYGPPI